MTYRSKRFFQNDRDLFTVLLHNGYLLTEKGKDCLELLRKHADLVGVFTQELSGSRMRRLDV
jgi:hypothetical protein